MYGMASLFDAINNLGSTTANTQNNGNQESVSEVRTPEQFCEKLTALGYNLDELKPILESDTNLGIPACAGAGKTTAIILKLLYDYLCGRYTLIETAPDGTQYKRNARILVSTFLKTGAEDLARQFDEWCRKMGVTGLTTENVTFTTLHAEFYAALRCMGVSIDICTDTSSIIRQCMRVYSIRNISTRARSKQATMEEVADVEGIFSYYRNRLDDSRFQHPLMEDYGLTKEALTAAVKYYLETLSQLGKFDFEMLEELLYDYMYKNPAVWNALTKRYDYVFVDEFQDVSQLQYAVLKPYFIGAKRVIAIGDDDQCIYSWRGSDNNILITRFAQDYGAMRLNLSTNYRCGADILKAVVPSIEKNTKRLSKTLCAANDGGTVDLVEYDCDAIDTIINSIKNDVCEKRTVGVLSRTNADLVVPVMAFELFAPEINYVISNGVSLGTKLPRMIFGSMDLFDKRYNGAFGDILRDLVPQKASACVTRLTTLLTTNPQLTLFDIDDHDYYKIIPDIAPLLCHLKARYYSKAGDGKRNAYMYLLRYMVDNVYVKDNSFCIKGRYLAKFVYDILANGFMADKTFTELSNLFNNELPARLETHRRKSAYTPTHCTITTVHDSKGKEWDSVYIWNDSQGTFPVKLVAGLSADNYEEERRLHYIAWTRPRKKLTVLYDADNPSPFLTECTLQKTAFADRVAQTTETTDASTHFMRKANTCGYACDTMVGVNCADLYKALAYASKNADMTLQQILTGVMLKGSMPQFVNIMLRVLNRSGFTTITYDTLCRYVLGMNEAIHNTDKLPHT